MTKQRLLTAVGIAVVVIGVLLLSGIPWVLPLVASAMSLMGTYELLCITKPDCGKGWIISNMILAVLIPLIPIPHYLHLLGLALPAAVVVFSVLMNRMDRVSCSHPGAILLLVVMISLFFKAMGELRFLDHGFLYLAMAIMICVVTDTAAYFFGRKFGKHKMAAKVSPKKTVEGAVGGALSAVFLMLLFGCLIQLGSGNIVSFKRIMLWSGVGTVISQFGDLAMSTVKRISHAKDFSNLFPGHGGILDRFDSSLFVIPFTLLYVSMTGPFIYG